MSYNEDELYIWRQGQATGTTPVTPITPAIILHQPKFPHNVGQIVRLASAFGIKQVWYSGNRVTKAIGERLPREERMRAYANVTLINHPNPLALFQENVVNLCPVAVEVLPSAEEMTSFLHPKNHNNPVYIFGPEDGSLPGSILKNCHRFVKIPSLQCLNLATAVAVTLYDRMANLNQPLSIQNRGRAA